MPLLDPRLQALPEWRKSWLIRHLWREGLAASPYAVQQLGIAKIASDGPNWWRVWLQVTGSPEFDVRRVRADREWDFDALIRSSR